MNRPDQHESVAQLHSFSIAVPIVRVSRLTVVCTEQAKYIYYGDPKGTR